ncbi:MAG: MerR family transcriptional regulator [Bacteroidales bacterium]|nr:MerR family transcriptional regulator [Clostridium sp.]MCM1204013.1 MerR family transcriptional regulator [Bacteroidales bacterium]
MKIKDVEKLTGLTAKSIRYYESKGLLQVERDEGNSYRSYSEENVQELRKIRLLRFLDFSIEQILDIRQMDEKQLKVVLLDKAESLENQRGDLEIKRNLCRTLSKEGITNAAVVEKYNEIFDSLGDEWQEDLSECLQELRCPSIAETIGETLIFSGPVLWLFLNISIKRWSALPLNAALAIISTAFLTGIWMNYLRKRRYQPKRVRKNNRSTWYLLPAAIISCVLGIVLMIFLMMQIDKMFAPPEWLFSQIKPWAETLLIILIMIPVMLLVSVLFAGITDKESRRNKISGWKAVRRYWYLFVAVWLVAGYFCVTSTTYVTEEKIIVHTPFCPQGKSYFYQDVAKVEAGFGQKTFSLHRYERRGEFSYTIVLDGKRIVFMQPSVNEDIARYEEDTYLELEEFDIQLMKLGIDKEADETGYEDCDFDKRYVDRFRRIIAN